jgi:hypothetical protein
MSGQILSDADLSIDGYIEEWGIVPDSFLPGDPALPEVPGLENFFTF